MRLWHLILILAVVWGASMYFMVYTLAIHSHEIASGAGGLAHDFMSAAKGNASGKN